MTDGSAQSRGYTVALCEEPLILDPYELKTVVRALVVPPMATLLLAAVGLWWMKRRPKLGRALAVAGVALTWVCSIGATADALTYVLEKDQQPLTASMIAAARQGGQGPGAIVVLGGGAVRDGSSKPQRERLHERTIDRVLAAARLARASGLPLLVTGGRPEWLTHAEAELMRDMLQDDLGLPVRWVEDRSRDTAENAQFSAQMLKRDGISSVVLVTQAYHMPRSKRTFEAAGLKVLPAPHGFKSTPPGWGEWADWVPSASGMETVWLASRELIGLLWYRLRGLG
jgi:uncharacterized SAM-binding protein YcdF (DUF218 family)